MSPSPLPSPSPSPKRERRKQARPGELLASALELFVEKGFAATRVDEVAQRAGVSKGTLFLYFPSKEELFKAVVRENISGRFAEWTGILQTYQGSSADLLRMAMHRWWERIGSTRASGIPKLVMSESGNFPELARFFQSEVLEPGNDLIRQILQRGVERGEFRALDETYGVYSVIAPMMFLSMWKHSMAACGGSMAQLEPLKYLNSQIDTILHGLCIAPSASAVPTAAPVGNSLPS